MKARLVVGGILLAAAVASGAAIPAAGGGGYDNPAWGSFIRSWRLSDPQLTAIAVMPDGYIVMARWRAMTHWYVYTSAGSFVRSVAASGVTGARDASSGGHGGPGYFVSITPGTGVSRWRYTNGGWPGSSPVDRPVPAAQGRGVGWDGTYYYATTGSWGSPIGLYTTAGSLVGTVPGTAIFTGMYGHATAPGYGYIDIAESSRRHIYHFAGTIRRSLVVNGTPTGVDLGPDGYLYVVAQPYVVVLTTDYNVGLRPASVGRIKTLFR